MEFKEIYEGYAVSKEGVVLGRRGKPMSPTDNGRGYLIVKMNINGKWTSKAVHRLVAEAWVLNPEGLSDVNHLDCNRYNNRAENLEWCTHGYNIEYSYKQDNRSATGEYNSRCKTSPQIVLEICKLLQEGVSAAKIRDKGFPYDLVRKIKSRQNWQHISKDFIW